jgi:DNA-binding transcriptional regulator YbjK
MVRMSSLDRRAGLIDAALRVVAAEGVQGATTRAIVAEAGMPLASFHYVFESRDELMRELVAHVTSRQADAVLAQFSPGTEIRSSIRDALATFAATVSADPEHELAMLELMQYALRTPGLAHLAREQYDRYRDAAAELLRIGADQARVEWTIPLREVARLVVTITDGITLAWLADRDDAGAARVVELAADSLAALTRPIAVPPTRPAPSIQEPAV